MCGINIICDYAGSLDHQPIRRMVNSTKHRGPDETLVKIVEHNGINFHLGANRLKITDHSDYSSQPFLSEDDSKALLFNGEIYNYDAIKNELLSQNMHFQSPSDTEALFHWLSIFGSERLDELEGMFAFVFIDSQQERVLLSRDRFGIKPLYYFCNSKYFIASSEIQSILQTGLVPQRLNDDQVHHYLLYKYANAPETFYRDIKAVQPGEVLELDNHIKLHSFTYTRPIEIDHQLKYEVDKIEDILKDNLIQQINAKVPLGLLLSGGVDSTLLLALAREEGFTTPTFSIVNSVSDAGFGTDDYKYSCMAAELYGSEHHEIEVNPSLLDDFESFISQLDQPIGDSSYMMTSEVSRQAADSIKILLSGAGADELFAGYNRHWAFYQYLKNYKRLGMLLPPLRFAAKFLPSGRSLPWRKQFRMVKKLADAIDLSPASTFDHFMQFTEMANRANTSDISFQSHEEWLYWCLNHDLKNYLVKDVLELTDKASMQHGVEIRVPYLNEKLVKYVKMRSQTGLFMKGRKWILKEILNKYQGRPFTKRPKEGFGLPISKWMTDKRSNHLWEFTEKESSLIFKFIDRDILSHIIDQHLRQKEDHGSFLWAVLVLSHWLEQKFA
jgi:asparagine synthase (glutamine-hydrolysing)